MERKHHHCGTFLSNLKKLEIDSMILPGTFLVSYHELTLLHHVARIQIGSPCIVMNSETDERCGKR